MAGHEGCFTPFTPQPERPVSKAGPGPPPCGAAEWAPWSPRFVLTWVSSRCPFRSACGPCQFPGGQTCSPVSSVPVLLSAKQHPREGQQTGRNWAIPEDRQVGGPGRLADSLESHWVGNSIWWSSMQGLRGVEVLVLDHSCADEQPWGCVPHQDTARVITCFHAGPGPETMPVKEGG